MTTILAVDDSPSMRQMISHTLRAAGYEVVEAVDGMDALEKIGARDIDIVLTDQNMPRMDGIALTRTLRSLAQHQKLPVLILTTETDEAIRQAGRAAGATGWLLKPFQPTRLLEVISRVAPKTSSARTTAGAPMEKQA